jgi:hypothetical protein
MNRLIRILVLMVLFSGWGFSQGYTFKVRHDHDPWGKWLAGRDRPYEFTVFQGLGLTDEVFLLISENLKTPVVDRKVFGIKEVLYEIPAKHLHTFGGCEGILRFGREMIVFDSEDKEDSRTWRREREVAGVWSSGKYDLDIVVQEREGRDLNRERRFRFQLKEPLDEEFYFRLRREFLP